MAFPLNANQFGSPYAPQGPSFDDPLAALFYRLTASPPASPPPAPNGNGQALQPQPAAPQEPNPQHVEEATQYVTRWLRNSVDYVQRKIDRWNLLEDLYFNRRRIDEWSSDRDSVDPAWYMTNRAARRQEKRRSDSWRSKMCIAVAPFVDTQAEQIHQAVFANDEFYKVKPGPNPQTGSVEDPEFPTSRKIQTWLLQSCTDLFFKNRVMEALKDGGIFGTVVAKLPWYEEKSSEPTLNPMTMMPEYKATRQGTPLDIVNLAKFLPDPKATSADVQRWSGVGDRSNVPYEVIRSRFRTPLMPKAPYNCGYEEFLRRWPREGERNEYPEQIKDDPNNVSGTEESSESKLQVWEWHGRIPFTDAPFGKECVVTIVTDLQTNLQGASPSGIVVRLDEQPILRSINRRPYIVWHYIPQSQAFGMGEIERNLDLIWTISHLKNLFIDAVRMISIPTIKAWYNSPWLTESDGSQKTDQWYPGKVLKFRNNPNEIEAFNLQVANLTAVQNLIQFLEAELEKRTSVSDANRGMSQRRKTASEVHALLQQGQRAPATKLSLFKESFLDPYGKIALAHFQQNVMTDQVLYIKGPTGPPVPMTLTTEEIRSGEYIVTATLDIQSEAKVSKAQTIMQVLPMLEKLQPQLLQENKLLRVAGLVEAFLRYVDITEIATVLQDIDDNTKNQILQQQMMAQAQQGQGQGQPQAQGGAQGGGGANPQVEKIMAEVHNIMNRRPGMHTRGGPAGPQASSFNEFLQRRQFNAASGAPGGFPMRRAA